jgi:hypothetical protein
MFRSAAVSYVAVRSIDPTDHGSNLAVVAGLAVGILAFIGLLVFLITRRDRGAAGRRPERLTITRPPPRSPSIPRPGTRSEAGAGTSPGGGEPGGAEPDERPG